MAEVNYTKIEQTADSFYERLNHVEVDKIKSLTSFVFRQLQPKTSRLLIAGVGTVLRDKNANFNDVDIAVVGIEEKVEKRFDFLVFKLFEEIYIRMNPRESFQFNGYSCDYSVRGMLCKQKILLQTFLEEFKFYSKKIRIDDTSNSYTIRPVDLHFVFNKSVEEWIKCQEVPEASVPSRSITPYLLYAPLITHP